MKLEIYHNKKNWETVYTLKISDLDRMKIKLDAYDNALLDEIDNQSPISIADFLIGLELICRKIEQVKG